MSIPIYSRWLTVAIVLEEWRDLWKFHCDRVRLLGTDSSIVCGFALRIGPLSLVWSPPIFLPSRWLRRSALAWEWLKMLFAVLSLIGMISLIAERNELRQTVRALVQYCPAAST